VSVLGAVSDVAVVVAGGGHVVNAAGVVQALREQSGMSTPVRAAVWNGHPRDYMAAVGGCVNAGRDR
jgi:hypothetical protein